VLRAPAKVTPHRQHATELHISRPGVTAPGFPPHLSRRSLLRITSTTTTTHLHSRYAFPSVPIDRMQDTAPSQLRELVTIPSHVPPESIESHPHSIQIRSHLLRVGTYRCFPAPLSRPRARLSPAAASRPLAPSYRRRTITPRVRTATCRSTPRPSTLLCGSGASWPLDSGRPLALRVGGLCLGDQWFVLSMLTGCLIYSLADLSSSVVNWWCGGYKVNLWNGTGGVGRDGCVYDKGEEGNLKLGRGVRFLYSIWYEPDTLTHRLR
jgi:hypothetical protein